MVDKSAIGATGEAFEMVVERGKIREFARAGKSDHPDYLDAPEPVSPPTFLATMSFWHPPGSSPMGKVKLDLRRILHGEQEFTFHGPPPKAGTKLRAQTRVADIYEREGKRGGTMTFVVTVTEFTDESGHVVAESKGTAIETGKPPAQG
jgi:hypothetical protein